METTIFIGEEGMKDRNFLKNEQAWDAAEDSDDREEYCDASFAYSCLDLDYGSTPTWEEGMNGVVFDAPYWLEEHQGKHCQYVLGYYEPIKIGETIELDGVKYTYVDSQKLDEEQEHELEDGTLVYEYRGCSFLRILQKQEEE
jgi:hypothetical protein